MSPFQTISLTGLCSALRLTSSIFFPFVKFFFFLCQRFLFLKCFTQRLRHPQGSKLPMVYTPSLWVFSSLSLRFFSLFLFRILSSFLLFFMSPTLNLLARWVCCEHSPMTYFSVFPLDNDASLFFILFFVLNTVVALCLIRSIDYSSLVMFLLISPLLVCSKPVLSTLSHSTESVGCLRCSTLF